MSSQLPLAELVQELVWAKTEIEVNNNNNEAEQRARPIPSFRDIRVRITIQVLEYSGALWNTDAVGTRE